MTPNTRSKNSYSVNRVRSRKFVLALGIASIPFALGSPSYAQSTFATVQGTVLDSAGAIIPDATITITSEDTGAVETVHSNTSGEYRVFDLNAGTYTIVIARAGFGDKTIAHQTILARQVLRIDGKLAAAGVTTTVDVNASLATLSDDATISHSRSSSEINTLALNFRATDSTSPLYVATLTPGVQADPTGNISVAGGFAYTTSYSIDGISTVNVRSNGPSANLFPSVEAISEFKVNSANNDAEFGQPSDITVTTKGGGDKFHGGVYEFLQNNYFNASNPLTRSTPRVRANDFGGYLGGPLKIPAFACGVRLSFLATTKAPAVPSPDPSPSRSPRLPSAPAIYLPFARPASRRAHLHQPRAAALPTLQCHALPEQSGSGQRVLALARKRPLPGSKCRGGNGQLSGELPRQLHPEQR